MSAQSLPAASLRTGNRLPAGQARNWVSKYLIWKASSSICSAICGASSRFLPARREAPGSNRRGPDRGAGQIEIPAQRVDEVARVAKQEVAGGSNLPGELADAVVLGIADVDRPIRSDDGAVRAAETGRGRRTAVTLGALAPAGDRLDDAARGIDAADRMVLGIDDQDVAAGVEGEFLGCVEHRIARRTIVAAVAARTGAGDGIDDPGAGIDRAQRAGLPLEDIDCAVGCHLDGTGAEHAGTARRAAVAAVLRLAGAGEGRDRAGDEIDHADAMVGHI